MVTPYVGVWIETKKHLYPLAVCLVTPYVGVWIETPYSWSEHRKD